MEEVKQILEKMSAPSKEEMALVEKAYAFAKKAHEGQTRYSGEPYIVHPVETARELARFGMSAKVIAAGLLHDTIEDAGVAPQEIEKEFGKEVLFLVEGVTKLGRFKYHGAERHRESMRKLLVATGQDARVLIIKLMDRLHNMRTLSYVPEAKRRRIALETLDIYAAIAHRLGIGVVRKELEDLAFQYAYPDDYAKTKALVKDREKEVMERLEKLQRILQKELAKNGIVKFHTDHRVKGFYSLWQKLERKGGDIGKIYDIAALRVIVPTVEDCYRVLGIVHNLWQPLPNKIKDYIAFPKPNGYQSLHTTVFSGDGGIVEVQIRTEAMHREAMYGIAAHVMYKGEAGSEGRSSFDWIKSLIPGFSRRPKEVPAKVPQSKNKSGKEPQPKTLHETRASGRHRYGAPGGPDWLANLSEQETDPDFDTTMRTDIFSHRVFVFTPTGDVVDLPVGASPIDFAYAIHSDIGDHTFGAKINGKLMPLDCILENGDIVEIQTKKTAHPSAKWLDSAKTTLARRHIRLTLEKTAKK